MSYTSLHYHIVFSTKGRKSCFDANDNERLNAYFGGIVRSTIHKLILCMLFTAFFLCCQGCSLVNCAGKLDNKASQVLASHDWPSYVGDGKGIWVSVKKQRLFLIDNNEVQKCYTCSTSKTGTGSEANSGKTPLGWHQISEKIGDGLPTGAILKDRQWAGPIWRPNLQMQGDLILSRILWLEGLQDGINRGGNVDTKQRYIYIHGTNRVNKLGKPASAGCVRLDPDQVIDLYGRVNEGCCVLITRE